MKPPAEPVAGYWPDVEQRCRAARSLGYAAGFARVPRIAPIGVDVNCWYAGFDAAVNAARKGD